jgi:hypothetical protein
MEEQALGRRRSAITGTHPVGGDESPTRCNDANGASPQPRHALGRSLAGPSRARRPACLIACGRARRMPRAVRCSRRSTPPRFGSRGHGPVARADQARLSQARPGGTTTTGQCADPMTSCETLPK